MTGVNPAAGGLPGAAPNNATLAVGNVKRIWGAQSAEEVKAPEIAPSSTAAGVSQQASQAAPGVTNQPASSSKKVAPEPSKADRKKQKAAAALFGGISSSKKDSSDDDDDDSEATPTKPEATQPA